MGLRLRFDPLRQRKYKGNRKHRKSNTNIKKRKRMKTDLKTAIALVELQSVNEKNSGSDLKPALDFFKLQLNIDKELLNLYKKRLKIHNPTDAFGIKCLETLINETTKRIKGFKKAIQILKNVKE
jgi:hypothetical protein